MVVLGDVLVLNPHGIPYPALLFGIQTSFVQLPSPVFPRARRLHTTLGGLGYHDIEVDGDVIVYFFVYIWFGGLYSYRFSLIHRCLFATTHRLWAEHRYISPYWILSTISSFPVVVARRVRPCIPGTLYYRKCPASFQRWQKSLIFLLCFLFKRETVKPNYLVHRKDVNEVDAGFHADATANGRMMDPYDIARHGQLLRFRQKHNKG